MMRRHTAALPTALTFAGLTAGAAQAGDLKKALADLGDVPQQRVACHAGYRVH